MPDREDDAYVVKTLEEHLGLGPHKAVSYLPVGTLEEHLHLSPSAYVEMARKRGHSWKIFAPDQCCIKTGAVYIYSGEDLGRVLTRNADILRQAGFPADPGGFLAVIARDWLPPGHPVTAVIRQAFGDGQAFADD